MSSSMCYITKNGCKPIQRYNGYHFKSLCMYFNKMKLIATFKNYKDRFGSTFGLMTLNQNNLKSLGNKLYEFIY